MEEVYSQGIDIEEMMREEVWLRRHKHRETGFWEVEILGHQKWRQSQGNWDEMSSKTGEKFKK